MVSSPRPNGQYRFTNPPGIASMRRPALRHTFLAASFLLTTALFAQTPSGPIIIESTGAADKSYVELEGIWADTPGKGGAEGLSASGTRKLIPVDGKMNGLAVFRPTIPAAGFYEIQVSYPAYANARGIKFAIEGVTRTMFPVTDFIPAGSPGSKADTWITVNDNLLLPEGRETLFIVDTRPVSGPAIEDKPFEIGINGVRFVPKSADSIQGSNPFASSEPAAAAVTTEILTETAPDTPVTTPAATPAVTSAPTSTRTDSAPNIADPFAADMRDAVPTPSASGSSSSSSSSTPKEVEVDLSALPADPFAAAQAPKVEMTMTIPPANPPLRNPNPPSTGDVADPFAAGNSVPKDPPPISIPAQPITPPGPSAGVAEGKVEFVAEIRPPQPPLHTDTPAVGENPFASKNPTPPTVAGTAQDDRIQVENPTVVEPHVIDASGSNPFGEGSTAPKTVIATTEVKPVVLGFKPMNSLDAGLKAASSNRQPIVLIFSSSTPAYRSFERNVLASDQTTKAMKSVVPVLLDLRSDRAVAQKYAVRRAPYAVVLDSNGYTKAHVSDTKDAASFASAVLKALQ